MKDKRLEWFINYVLNSKDSNKTFSFKNLQFQIEILGEKEVGWGESGTSFVGC